MSLREPERLRPLHGGRGGHGAFEADEMLLKR